MGEGPGIELASGKPDKPSRKTAVEDWLSSKLDEAETPESDLPTRPLTDAAPALPPAPRKRPATPTQPPRPAPTISSTAAQDTDPPSPPPPPLTTTELPVSLDEVDEEDPPTERLAVVPTPRPTPSPLPVQAGPSAQPAEEDLERKTRPLPSPEDQERTSSVGRGRPGVPSYTGGAQPGRLAGAVPPRPQARQLTRPRFAAPSPEGAVPRVAPLTAARPATPTWAVDPDEDVEDAPTVFTVSSRMPGIPDPAETPVPFEDRHDLDRGDTVSILGDLGAGLAIPSSPDLTPVVAPRRPDVPEELELSSPSGLSDIPDQWSEPGDENIHDAPTVAAAAIPDLSRSGESASAQAQPESADPTREPTALVAWAALGIVLFLVLSVVGLFAAILVGIAGL